MISLWKTATDLERLNDLQRVATDCYALAITTAAQYAVEVDRGQATEFRSRLQALEEAIRAASAPENLRDAATSFRGEVRDHQEKAHKRIAELRQEVAAAAAAMKAIAESVASSGADHQERLEQDLSNLQSLSKSDSLAEIRAGVRATVNSIAGTVDQMRRSNQLVIAQLQDEIRLLHQEIQAERRALHTDRASGAWNRQKLQTRIDELLAQDEPFALLVAGIRNLKQMERRHPEHVVETALKAALKRFQKLLGEEVMIGRWGEQQFVAVLPMKPSNLMALSQEVTRKLSGDYAIQANARSHTVSLDVAAGIVDRRVGGDADKFRARLEKIAEALLNA